MILLKKEREGTYMVLSLWDKHKESIELTRTHVWASSTPSSWSSFPDSMRFKSSKRNTYCSWTSPALFSPPTMAATISHRSGWFSSTTAKASSNNLFSFQLHPHKPLGKSSTSLVLDVIFTEPWALP